MRRFPAVTKKRSRIEIIPMIDVMMFLLVFFVLISINVIPSTGIKLSLPQSSQAAPVSTQIKIVIALSSDGSITMSGESVPNIQELKNRLLRLKTENASNRMQIMVSCDQKTQMQPFIDVIDVLKQTGLEAVNISAQSRSS